MTRLALVMFLAGLAAACPPPGHHDPSDDPDDWEVDTSVEYDLDISDPQWIVPSDNLPKELALGASNNNVGIEFFEGRLFVAFRTAETHWGSPETALYVISSEDDGKTWAHELTVELGTDAREPILYRFEGQLHFVFFEAGDSQFSFTPKKLWRTTRQGLEKWTGLEEWGEPGTVIWDLKVRKGQAFLTHYLGSHYDTNDANIDVFFSQSEDGLSWSSVGGSDEPVYNGGCSEASFETDADGSLWAVLRNEDGDATGFGSLLCHAPADDWSTWDCPDESDPERYDSPRLFRHGDDLYLAARRDIDGPFGEPCEEAESMADCRRRLLTAYWNRPKRTAIYTINKDEKRVEHLVDLPSAGDTAFPSIRRTGAHTFLMANYSSPVDDPDRTWIEGQGAVDGTGIYLVELSFLPKK
jgi:hypothetical protein